MNKLILVLSGSLLLGMTIPASAVTLASDNTIGTSNCCAALGESVTTPDGGPWDTITFNFIAETEGGSPTVVGPFAIGSLYVLSQAYAGLAGDLSSSTPGFFGFTSTINNGVWDFSGLTLQPDTQY